MTTEYDALHLATLVTFTFGALTFSVLTLFYWREGRPRDNSVFAAFTAVSAVAFLTNLLRRTKPNWETPLTVALNLSTGFIPALLFHLVSRAGRRVLLGFYAMSAAIVIAAGLDDAEILTLPYREALPAVLLGATGIMGLLFPRDTDSRLRAWYRLLLSLTAAAAAASLIQPSAVTILAPDYLLLAFFCVTLYYQERLIFFDLLIKRGMFFCLSLASLILCFRFMGLAEPLTTALLLTPLWLLAPWADARLGRLIDHAWLRRRYSSVEAERLFTNELQAATSESDLRSRSESCLADIFQGTAEVRFAPRSSAHADRPEAMLAETENGWVILEQRRSGIPYMSDDRKLFFTLTRILAIMLENVRFRTQSQQQQEREQQLRLLASRAELKSLRAQINPHFLFNSLNAIAGLIPSQPALADQTVEQLAQVFRYTLRRSENEWVRLDEEVEFVTAYLRIEQARFGDRLQIELHVDAEAGAVSIPAMSIQPLVENAIKHGASVVEGLGTVKLCASVQNGMLTIEVYDNGPGFDAKFSIGDEAGHGLRNVADRLRGYYGAAARLHCESGSNTTRVSLEIPCETTYARSERD